MGSMRRTPGVVAIVLAGCQPHGLLVEVHGQNVELFVAAGDAPCDDSDVDKCPMTPPDPAAPDQAGTTTFKAHRWIDNTTAVIAIDTTGDTATYLLQTDGTGDATIAALLAVGFDGTTVSANPTTSAIAHGVVVPSTGQSRIILELAPVDPIASPQSASTDRIQVWRAPSERMRAGTSDPNPTRAPCVLVSHPNDATPRSESFSPADDTDCDEAEAINECDKFAAFAKTAARDLSCLITPMTPTDLCELGGVACQDGVAPNTTAPCLQPREPWCLPAALCTNTQPNCAGMLGSCLDTPAITAASNGVGLACTFPIDGNGVPCTSSGTVHVDLHQIAAPCDVAEISASTVPLDFQGSATLGTTPPLLQVDLQLTDPASCLVDLDVQVDPATTEGGIGYIQIEPGGLPTQHRVIPILFRPSDMICAGAEITCRPLPMTFPANETILSCQ
jgi:hypothetical protein